MQVLFWNFFNFFSKNILFLQNTQFHSIAAHPGYHNNKHNINPAATMVLPSHAGEATKLFTTFLIFILTNSHNRWYYIKASLSRAYLFRIIYWYAVVAKLAHAHDSGSCGLTSMRVQLPSTALLVTSSNAYKSSIWGFFNSWKSSS